MKKISFSKYGFLGNENYSSYLCKIFSKYVIMDLLKAKANYDLLTAIMVNLGAEANQAAKSLLKLLTLLLRSNMTLSEKEAIIATEYDIKMKNDIRNEEFAIQ